MMLEDLAATGTLADSVLSFTPVTAEVAGGRVTMGARVEGGAGVPGFGLTFAAEEVAVDDVSQMLFGENLSSGEATASLQLEGRGRSLLGMVSSLAGKGTLSLAEGQLSGFDLTGFRAAIDDLSSMNDFDRDAASKLETGFTPYSQIDGAVAVEEGILRFTPEQVEVTGGDSIKIGAMADLVRLEADVETELTLPGAKPLPPLTMVLAGPLNALERRNDTLAIQQAVSQALLVRDIEEAGIEDLPDELRDLIIAPDSGSELDAPLEGVIEALPPDTPTPVERPAN